jgi:hypothetical protein
MRYNTDFRGDKVRHAQQVHTIYNGTKLIILYIFDAF